MATKKNLPVASIGKKAQSFLKDINSPHLTAFQKSEIIRRLIFKYKLSLEQIARSSNNNIMIIAILEDLSQIWHPFKYLYDKNKIPLQLLMIICRYPLETQKKFYSWMMHDAIFTFNDIIIMDPKKDLLVADKFFTDLLMPLTAAPFNKDKFYGNLMPCTLCSQRSKYNPSFSIREQKFDYCLNINCFLMKRDTFIQNQIMLAKSIGQFVWIKMEQFKNKYELALTDEICHHVDDFKYAKAKDKDFIIGVVLRSNKYTDLGKLLKLKFKRGIRRIVNG